MRSTVDQLFRLLREQFNVPDIYSVRLDRVDAGQRPPQDVAAYAMWQVQLLYHLTTPGVIATSEAVISTCAQLAFHLKLLAEDAADTHSADTMLQIRQDIFLAARAVAAIDGAVEGPAVELF